MRAYLTPLFRMLLPLAGAAALLSVVWTADGAIRPGDALLRTGPGWSMPLHEGSFASVSAATLVNESGGPLTLVRARPVWTDHVSVTSVRVSPLGLESSGAVADRSVPGTSPVRGFVIPSSRSLPEDRSGFSVTLEVTLDRGEPGGLLLGMDITYRQGGRNRVQRLPAVLMLCEWTGTGCPRTYYGADLFSSSTEALLERFQDDRVDGDRRERSGSTARRGTDRRIRAAAAPAWSAR